MINSVAVRLFSLSILFLSGCPPENKSDMTKSEYIVSVEWHEIQGPNRQTWYRTRVPNGWLIYTNVGYTSPLYIPDGKALWLSVPDKDF